MIAEFGAAQHGSDGHQFASDLLQPLLNSARRHCVRARERSSSPDRREARHPALLLRAGIASIALHTAFVLSEARLPNPPGSACSSVQHPLLSHVVGCLT